LILPHVDTNVDTHRHAAAVDLLLLLYPMPYPGSCGFSQAVTSGYVHNFNIPPHLLLPKYTAHCLPLVLLLLLLLGVELLLQHMCI
jgi:hypothetical protein